MCMRQRDRLETDCQSLGKTRGDERLQSRTRVMSSHVSHIMPVLSYVASRGKGMRLFLVRTSTSVPLLGRTSSLIAFAPVDNVSLSLACLAASFRSTPSEEPLIDSVQQEARVPACVCTHANQASNFQEINSLLLRRVHTIQGPETMARK